MKAIETEYNGYRFRSRLEARWAVFFDALGIEYEYEPEGYKNDDGICYLPDFYLPDFRCLFEVKKGGVLKHGCIDPKWLEESDDGRKINAITESLKLRNNNKNYDFIILASGTPYDCYIADKEDCGLVFNGIIGLINYSTSNIMPLTQLDGLSMWGHMPVKFEMMRYSKDFSKNMVFLGKREYSDYKASNFKTECVPIGKKCVSIGTLQHRIIPRYRGEPLMDLDEVECIAIAFPIEGNPIYDACITARQARFEHGENPDG